MTPLIAGGLEGPATIEEIERLIAYWEDGFDWRAEEARLGRDPAVPGHRRRRRPHFVHVRGVGDNPTPLLLTNVWPSSFVEYAGVLLADPTVPGRRLAGRTSRLDPGEVADLE